MSVIFPGNISLSIHKLNYVEPPLSLIEQFTVEHLQDRGQLSKLYNIDGWRESSHSDLSAWRNDLKLDVSTEEWEKTCVLTHTQSINTRGRLLQYKWLFNSHYSC